MASSSTGAIGSGSMAMSGLSGYDFSGVVDSLVQAYKLPENKMIEKQTKLQKEKDAWRDVNTRLSNLDGKLTTLRTSTTWNASSVTSSNSNILTASAGINAVQGQYNVTVKETAKAQTVVTAVQNVASATAATTVGAGSFNITVNGTTKTVNVAAGDSLSTIAASINNANAGVRAAVVQVSGGYQLAITDNQTGTANTAGFADVSGGVLQTLGVLDAGGGLNNPTADPNQVAAGGISQLAKDANLTINGISNITSSTNTVTSAIPGVTLNLNGADPNANVVINVTADNSVAQKAVQDFVDQYNSTMEFLSTKLSYNSDTKVKGDLFGNAALQGIQARLRNMAGGTFSNPSGSYTTLSSIGVSTSAEDFGKDAKLALDTAKFNSVMVTDPQSVANLFSAPYGGVTPADTAGNRQGVANTFHAYLDPIVKYGGTLDQTEDNLDNQITDMKKQIEDFERRAAEYEERQKAKYARLEAELSKLSSQGQWLDSQIKSLEGQNKDK